MQGGGEGNNTELTAEEVAAWRLQFATQCAVSLGAYLEFRPYLWANGGVRLVLRLLDSWKDDPIRLHDALQWLASLMAHRRSGSSPGSADLSTRCGFPRKKRELAVESPASG